MHNSDEMPDPLDADYVPGEAEIGISVADAYLLGEHVDVLRSDDAYGALTPYDLATARTEADAAALAQSYEAGLTATTTSLAPVLDLRQRAPHAPSGQLRAA